MLEQDAGNKHSANNRVGCGRLGGEKIVSDVSFWAIAHERICLNQGFYVGVARGIASRKVLPLLHLRKVYCTQILLGL